MEEKILENEKDTPIKEARKFRVGLIAGLFVSLVALGTAWAFTMPLTTCTHKPAIYLYNSAPLQVSVKLDKSIKQNIVIPKHTKKGWLVEADSTGYIRDLQPKYTKCHDLPYKKDGLDYAKEACQVNKYPYIFWDGSVKHKVDKKDKGFVVKKEDIFTFLNAKADELKFNKNEKHDFVDYWARQVKNADGKYFKITFIQNEEVDYLFPIKVKPRPESWNRVQIIVKKCGKNEKVEPQTLTPVTRDGFTLVEWGGIMQ